MPSTRERRAIEFFVDGYNRRDCDDKIIEIEAKLDQESPGAILRLDSGKTVGLEQTSAYAPGSRSATQRVFVQWPVPFENKVTKIGMFELPKKELWIPFYEKNVA